VGRTERKALGWMFLRGEEGGERVKPWPIFAWSGLGCWGFWLGVCGWCGRFVVVVFVAIRVVVGGYWCRRLAACFCGDLGCGGSMVFLSLITIVVMVP
jgi:hypothetical protein